MTTHDQHTEASRPAEGLEPAPKEELDHSNDQLDSSTVRPDPSAAQTVSMSEAHERSTAPTDTPSEQAQPPIAGAMPQTTRTESTAGTEQLDGSTDHSAAGAETRTKASLFADDQLSGLRARWDHVQASFVDDPRECVHKADGLVSDVVDQLTTGFSSARTRLEEQWARGEEASTEDLRVALTRYRDFFERLLAV